MNKSIKELSIEELQVKWLTEYKDYDGKFLEIYWTERRKQSDERVREYLYRNFILFLKNEKQNWSLLDLTKTDIRRILARPDLVLKLAVTNYDALKRMIEYSPKITAEASEIWKKMSQSS